MIGISLVGQPKLANFCYIFLQQVGHNLYLAIPTVCLQGILASGSRTRVASLVISCMLRRYSHKLPYVLVKKATKAAVMGAHQRTKGRVFGEANHDMWAEEVVQNLPVVMSSRPDACNGLAVMSQVPAEALHRLMAQLC